MLDTPSRGQLNANGSCVPLARGAHCIWHLSGAAGDLAAATKSRDTSRFGARLFEPQTSGRWATGGTCAGGGGG